MYLHRAEIASAEENQSRRETDTLLTNTEEGGTEQGGGTDGPSWRHRGRRKRRQAGDGRRSTLSGGEANWSPEPGAILGCGLTQVGTLTSSRPFLMGPVLGRRMRLSTHVCVGATCACEHTFAPAVPSAWNTFPTLLKSFSPRLYLTES